MRPIPVLTINADAVHDEPFKVEDVIELRIGAEYFFATKIPIAVRAGYWRDPDHSVTWNGPLNSPDFIAEAMLYPGGEDQNHFSVGAAWPGLASRSTRRTTGRTSTRCCLCRHPERAAEGSGRGKRPQ